MLSKRLQTYVAQLGHATLFYKKIAFFFSHFRKYPSPTFFQFCRKADTQNLLSVHRKFTSLECVELVTDSTCKH